MEDIQVTLLYVKPGKCTKQKVNEIFSLQVVDDSQIIMGDLNLNPAIPNEKRRLEELCRDKKFTMDLKEDTTRNHNHIDHILVLNGIKERVYSTFFLILYQITNIL